VLVGGKGKNVEHMEGKNVRECSATCMMCGGGEGGNERASEGADAGRGGKERGGCGARVQERAWCCCVDDEGVMRKPDGGARWRADRERRRGAGTARQLRAAPSVSDVDDCALGSCLRATLCATAPTSARLARGRAADCPGNCGVSVATSDVVLVNPNPIKNTLTLSAKFGLQ